MVTVNTRAFHVIPHTNVCRTVLRIFGMCVCLYCVCAYWLRFSFCLIHNFSMALISHHMHVMNVHNITKHLATASARFETQGDSKRTWNLLRGISYNTEYIIYLIVILFSWKGLRERDVVLVFLSFKTQRRKTNQHINQQMLWSTADLGGGAGSFYSRKLGRGSEKKKALCQ
jgi:hypothetical protein